MARTLLALQATTRDGLDPTYTVGDAVNGHSFDNDHEDVALHVKNGGASPVVVTFATPNTIDGMALPDKTVTVPAGEERFIGPFPRSLYSQADAGNALTEAVLIDLDQASSVTLAALQLGSKSY